MNNPLAIGIAALSISLAVGILLVYLLQAESEQNLALQRLGSRMNLTEIDSKKIHSELDAMKLRLDNQSEITNEQSGRIAGLEANITALHTELTAAKGKLTEV